MKPETAYKMVEVWTITNTTIMTIFFVIACDSLWHAFCIIATVPMLGIGMMAMYEESTHDYTNLLKNVTEKDKKEMPYVRWDEAFKDARKEYLYGLIGITFVNLLFSAFMIFMLWIRFHGGEWRMIP